MRYSADDSTRHGSRTWQVLYGFKSFEFFPEVENHLLQGKGQNFLRTGKALETYSRFLCLSLASQTREPSRRTPRMHSTTPPATSASLAPHTLAMSCYGYDSRKQLNGHLSFQTTITNRLESTFPHRWALKFAMLVRRCYMNQAPAPLCRKLKRTSHHRSTRGNNMSLHPFKPSSLSGILSFSNRSPTLWNALQFVPNLCSLSLPKFKKVFTKLLLDSPKYISYAVGDVNRYT